MKKTRTSRYKLQPIKDSTHQWRLLELKPVKGKRGHHYVCIAIGTGTQNMHRLEKALCR